MSKLLSTGSTLLNLAFSDNPFGALLPGKYYFMVGDSASGKTFLSMTCFAEACRSKAFKDYRLIYDNIEDGMLMDLDRLFAEDIADRIEPPATDRSGEPVFSSTVEDFYFHLDDLVSEKKPFIYVLDSMDALDTEASEKKFAEHRRARRKRESGEVVQVAGSYGDFKAKKNSEGVRKVLKGLRKTRSILIVLSQTRDNLSSPYGGRTRSGGRALRFYATNEVWSSIVRPIKKIVRGKPRDIGVRVCLDVKKNRMTGRCCKVEIDIYREIGIDDIGSCVDYLVEEGFWSRQKQTIVASDLGIEATRSKLIRLIEKRGLESQLAETAGKCWHQTDEECALNRKQRYAVGDE